MTDTTEQATPRERLNQAIATKHKLLCDQHPCKFCDVDRVLLNALEQVVTFIRENRGRIHRATCMDGNGCRCGLIDLPIWGGAGELE